MGNWFSKAKMEVEERFILSIDGGGIRGLVPSVILSRLASGLKERGDARPLYAHFDLIAGTSTGALLALGLSLPVSGVKREEGGPVDVHRRIRTGLFRHSDVVVGQIERASDPAAFTDLYLDNAKRIFSRSGRLFGQVFGDKYDASSLEDFLMRSYGEARLSDCLVPTMAVSYDSISGSGLVLSSWNGWKDMLAAQAARASCAAPLYFPAFTTLSPDGTSVALLDGGLVANNPALMAYSELKAMHPECAKVHILSLSTARGVYRFDPKEVLSGVAGWVEPLMKTYPNAQMDLIGQTLAKLPDVDYVRIDGELTKEKIKLDDTRKESMDRLIEGGERIYEANKDRISAFLDRLASRTVLDSVRLTGPRSLPQA